MAIVVKTLGPGKDYETLTAWYAAEGTNLIADGDSHELHCDAFTLDDQLDSLANFVRGPSNTLTIMAAPGAEHNGVIGAGFRLHTATAGFEGVLNALGDYTILKDFTVINDAALSSITAIIVGGEGCVYTNMIAAVPNAIDGTGVAFEGSSDPGGEFYNCLAYGGGGGRGFTCLNYDSPIYANCLAVGLDVGFRSEGANADPLYNNCVAYGNTSADFDMTDTVVAAASSNNASGDTSAVGPTPITGIVAADFTDYAA